MICTSFSKSELYFAKLDSLEMVEHLLGFPARETECDSRRGWAGSGSRGPLHVTGRASSGRGPALGRTSRLAERWGAPWPPSLRTYLRTASPESHAPCAPCVAPPGTWRPRGVRWRGNRNGPASRSVGRRLCAQRPLLPASLGHEPESRCPLTRPWRSLLRQEELLLFECVFLCITNPRSGPKSMQDGWCGEDMPLPGSRAPGWEEEEDVEIGMWTGTSSQELNASLNWPPYTKKMSSKVGVAGRSPWSGARGPTGRWPTASGVRPGPARTALSPAAEPPVSGVRHGASCLPTAPAGAAPSRPTPPAHPASRPLLCPVSLLRLPPFLSLPHPKRPRDRHPQERTELGFASVPIPGRTWEPRASVTRAAARTPAGGCARPGQASRGSCHRAGVRTAGLGRGLPHRRCWTPGSSPPEHHFPAWAPPPGWFRCSPHPV